MRGQPENKEFLTAGIGGFVMFCTAATYAWSSPLLSSFRNVNSTIYLTSMELGLLTSVCDMSNVVISVPAAYLSDMIGRKFLIWATAPVCGFSWFFLLTYKTKTVLFTVRIVQGLMLGIQNSVLTNYMAEVCSAKVRGNVISYTNITWHLGTLYVYVVGTFFGFDGLTWFTLVPNMIFAVLFFWYPESPYYLIMSEKRDKAVEVLSWLRGGTKSDIHISKEIQIIDETIKHEASINKGAWKNLFYTRKGRKSLFIVELVTVVFAIGGTNTIPVYASDTVTKLSGSANLGNDITIILGALLVLVVLPPIFLADKWGRRPLLLLSMAGSAFFFIPTAILLYLIQVQNVTAISVKTSCYIFLIVAMSFTTLGVETLQPVIVSEFFPSTSRSISAGATNTFITLLQSMSTYLYEYIDDEVGIYLNYVVFLVVTVIGLIGIYFLMPETKCKTFSEIQSIL